MISSPEQPDLIQRGQAAAKGGCERQRAMLEERLRWPGVFISW